MKKKSITVQILEYMNSETCAEVRLTEIATHFKLKSEIVSSRLWQLKERGLIERIGIGLYKITKKGEAEVSGQGGKTMKAAKEALKKSQKKSGRPFHVKAKNGRDFRIEPSFLDTEKVFRSCVLVIGIERSRQLIEQVQKKYQEIIDGE